MGCSSSSNVQHQTSYINRKPQIWFIGGGPGSNKGKIIQYLVRDYKYLHLSIFQMLQFQKQRNTSDSQIIKKSIIDKKDFSSQLLTRLLKKAIASLGSRRYLIDGYPRNKQDIEQLQKQNFNKQIIFQKFIHIQTSNQKMKRTGLQAKQGDKRSKQQIQKQINQVINNYLKKQQQMIQHYKLKNSLISIGQKQTEDQTYNQLRLQFQNIKKFRNISQGDSKVFFTYFDNQKDLIKYSHYLSKQYGLYFYDFKELIKQTKLKNNNQSKFIQQSEKKKQILPSQFVLHLIRKKIQKKDYLGNFILSGFPRNINDAQQWSKTFGWETVVQNFITFQLSQDKLKTQFQQTHKNQDSLAAYQKYIKNRKVLSDFYQKQQKYIKINSQNNDEAKNILNNILIEKGIQKRKLLMNKKLIFLSTINMNESQKMRQFSNCKQINMMYCYQNQIKQNSLYSQLIQSYISSGYPLPGDISVRILLKNLSFIDPTELPETFKILVKGFPNSVQQLVSWNEQIGNNYSEPCILYISLNEQKIKKKLSLAKIDNIDNLLQAIKKNSKQLKQYLQMRQIKNLQIQQKTSNQQIVSFIS